VTAISDYAPISRLPEFIAGMALGRLMLVRGGPALRGSKLALMTLVAAGTCLMLAALGNSCPWYFSAAGGLTPLLALMIWSLTVDGSFVARLLEWAPLVFLGEVSYSVYIIHLPLAHWFGVAVTHITHRPDTDTFLDIPNYVVFAIYLPVLLIFCSLIYRLFEIPVRDLIRNRLSRQTKPPIPASIEASVSPT
jgi:peptidoglycan/LPS O-acetylase OafA/YrhL